MSETPSTQARGTTVGPAHPSAPHVSSAPRALGRRLTIRTPVPRETWAEVHRADPEALVSQSPEWTSAICATGRWRDVSRLYESTDGLRIVLPLVAHRSARLGLQLQTSMPHAWGMGGFIADGQVDAETMAGIVNDLRRAGALQIRIRPNPLHDDVWSDASGDAVVVPRHAHVLDLEPGADAVFASFHKSTRRGIRKAKKANLTIEVDGTGRLIPVFQQLHRLSVERWAAAQNEPLALARWRADRVDPPARLEAMARALGESCRVWMAWHEGQPVAASIILMGKNASATRAAMDKDLAAKTRANDLLEWSAISEAVDAGCRRYHFGESAPGSGVAIYKERFGALGHDYSEYRLERLPITRLDRMARTAVKKAIRFKDA